MPADFGANPIVFKAVLGAVVLAAAIALPTKFVAPPGPFRPAPAPAIRATGPAGMLTDSEIKRLMKYHGVLGLRITADRAYIKRNKRWVCVFHDPPTASERTIVGRRETTRGPS